MRSSLLAALVAVFLTGCQSDTPGVNSPHLAGQRVDQVAVSAPLQAVLEANNRPQAVRVLVQFYDSTQALPVSADGVLELRMHDGRIPPESISSISPDSIWTFTSPELKSMYRHVGYGLWGYPLILQLEHWQPKRGVITVQARYLPTGGGEIFSSPIHIVLGGEG